MTGIIGHAHVTGTGHAAALAAARAAIAAIEGGYRPYAVWYVADTVVDPAVTSAARLHADLGLASFAGAYDMCGSARSAVGALKIASTSTMMTVLAGADGAAAFCFGKGDALADEAAGANVTAVDDPSGAASVAGALAAALEGAGAGVDDLGLVLVSGNDPSALATAVGAIDGVDASRLRAGVGTGVVLSTALAEAAPGSLLAQVVGCDGVDVRLWRIGGTVAPM
jgi:hypothetical protein